MFTFKLRLCDEGSMFSAYTNDGDEICHYAISPESTYAILEVIGNVINIAEPIIGNKISLVESLPVKSKGKKREKK